jgi:hypothetical protein
MDSKSISSKLTSVLKEKLLETEQFKDKKEEIEGLSEEELRNFFINMQELLKQHNSKKAKGVHNKNVGFTKPTIHKRKKKNKLKSKIVKASKKKNR